MLSRRPILVFGGAWLQFSGMTRATDRRFLRRSVGGARTEVISRNGPTPDPQAARAVLRLRRGSCPVAFVRSAAHPSQPGRAGTLCVAHGLGMVQRAVVGAVYWREKPAPADRMRPAAGPRLGGMEGTAITLASTNAHGSSAPIAGGTGDRWHGRKSGRDRCQPPQWRQELFRRTHLGQKP